MTKFIELPTSVVKSAQGADVSNFQGIMASTFWSPYQFGFAKATEGTTFLDHTFAGNWMSMKAAKIHRGAYHFFHPAIDPIAQAKFFVNTVKAQGLGAGDMLVADVEITSGNAFTRMFKKHRNNLTQTPVSLATVNLTAKAFLDEVKSLVGDRNPILVYSNLSVGSQLSSCTDYPLWIAWPSMSAPPSVKPWPNWTFWQWGVVSNIDRDAFNGTAADLDAWINTYMAPPITTGPYKHTLTHDASVYQIAHDRNTSVSKFLAHQSQYFTDTDAIKTTWHAGSVYYTVNL